MKIKNIILLLNTILFSVLFYKQSIGVNILIFNCVITASLIITQRSLKLNYSTYLIIGASLIASISCFLYGTTVCLIAYIFSAILLTASINEKKLSLPSLFLTGFLSIFVSLTEKISQPKQKKDNTLSNNINPILILFVLAVFLLFLMIYGFSNPNFSKLLLKINLNFISLQWILFTLISFIFLYGVINWFGEKGIISWDLNQKTKLSPTIKFNSELVSANDFLKSGILLFLLLNLLLLTVNLSDGYHYLLDNSTDDNFNHSRSLHQSVISLITSILIAISLILIYFKGHLNFIKKNKWLIILASFWVFQNIILAVLSGYKNQLYINEYGLTHKRIGVYMYLTLTLIGLIFTYIKINKTKTNWYILKNISIVFFVFIISISTVNWNSIIINYNINRYNNTNRIDWRYLTSLYETSLPELVAIEKSGVIRIETEKELFHNLLYYKIKRLNQQKVTSWQSWNYLDFKKNEVLNEL